MERPRSLWDALTQPQPQPRTLLHALTGLPDVWDRATLVPMETNRQTGERRLAAPQAAMDLLSALMLPGDVAQGKVNMGQPGQPSAEAIQNAASMALNVGIGGSVVPKPSNALMAGMRYKLPILYWKEPYHFYNPIKWEQIGPGGVREIALDTPGTIIARSEYKPKDDKYWMRMQHNFFDGLPPDIYYRGSIGKDDYKHLLNKTHFGSTNHATGKREAGLSVAKYRVEPGDSFTHGYLVQGKKIGTGSDGEPILDLATASPASELMSIKQIVEMSTRLAKQRLEEIGLSQEQENLFGQPVFLNPAQYDEFLQKNAPNLVYK